MTFTVSKVDTPTGLNLETRVVLANTTVCAEDIDELGAIQAKEEAERLLKDYDKRLNLAQVQANLAKAVTQIQAISRLKKNL